MTKKEIAIDFLKLVSSGKVREAYEKYVHKDFFHHNAYYKGDRESLLKAMEEKAEQFPNKTYVVLRALEDDDLVSIHAKVTGVFDSDLAVIHIFRYEGNLIAEEWDVGQQVPPDSPNENGIF
jgi:predicted SnoaL-like aldol condensation-catalyzing enzyme